MLLRIYQGGKSMKILKKACIAEVIKEGCILGIFATQVDNVVGGGAGISNP